MKTAILITLCVCLTSCASDNLVFEFGFTTRTADGLHSATGTATYDPPNTGKNPVSK